MTGTYQNCILPIVWDGAAPVKLLSPSRKLRNFGSFSIQSKQLRKAEWVRGAGLRVTWGG